MKNLIKNFIKSCVQNLKAGVKILWEKIKAFFARIGAKIKRGFRKLRAKLFGAQKGD
ncbi:MAG: hypothetical protein KJ017_11400 [Alphaproteobacteria bacterium]|nr:hypothetical protein [Alphaproteobacteria bacterium]